MDFTSIDVETANPDLSSICQIGIVQFRDGAIAHRWKSFVNPDDYFDPMNISVHGIRESDVSDAPSFPSLHPNYTAISHRLSFATIHILIVRRSTQFTRGMVFQCLKYSGSIPRGSSGALGLTVHVPGTAFVLSLICWA